MSDRKSTRSTGTNPLSRAGPDSGDSVTHSNPLDPRAQIEAYVADARDYAQMLINASLDMIISVDITLRIVEFNPAAERSFGYTRDEVIGQPVDILYAEPDDAWPVRIDTFRNTANTEILNRRKNGEVFVSSLRSVRLQNKEGETIGVMGISREITAEKLIEQELTENSLALASLNHELEKANAKLHQLATTDELTELPNRRAMMEHLNQCWARAQREDTFVACVVLDVDNFKSINDTYGHDIGDEVLRTAAHAIRTASRSNEQVGRIGGEEFLLVLEGKTPEQALQGAERIRNSVATARCSVPDGQINVTMSAGFAMMDQQTHSVDELLKRADTALYAAKQNGRDRIECASAQSTVR